MQYSSYIGVFVALAYLVGAMRREVLTPQNKRRFLPLYATVVQGAMLGLAVVVGFIGPFLCFGAKMPGPWAFVVIWSLATANMVGFYWKPAVLAINRFRA